LNDLTFFLILQFVVALCLEKCIRRSDVGAVRFSLVTTKFENSLFSSLAFFRYSFSTPPLPGGRVDEKNFTS